MRVIHRVPDKLTTRSRQAPLRSREIHIRERIDWNDLGSYDVICGLCCRKTSSRHVHDKFTTKNRSRWISFNFVCDTFTTCSRLVHDSFATRSRQISTQDSSTCREPSGSPALGPRSLHKTKIFPRKNTVAFFSTRKDVESYSQENAY
jgi:hypothetical protein